MHGAHWACEKNRLALIFFTLSTKLKMAPGKSRHKIQRWAILTALQFPRTTAPSLILAPLAV